MIKGGPRIFDKDLVFCIDALDAKSYSGVSTNNLITSNGIDFSTMSGYSNLSVNRVTDDESPSGYACEMYETDSAANSAARSKFGDSTNIPTSGYAYISVWVKQVAGTANIRPYVYPGSSWYLMSPLDGHSQYLTNKYRPFGAYVVLGTNSGGPNPGFNMNRDGTTSAYVDKVRWIKPQVTTLSYAVPFTNRSRSFLRNIKNRIGNPEGGTLIVTDSNLVQISTSSNNSGGAYAALHSGWNLSNGQIPRYSNLILKYTVTSNNAVGSDGKQVIAGNYPGTHFGPGDLVSTNSGYSSLPLTVGTHYVSLHANGAAHSGGAERRSLYVRLNDVTLTSGTIEINERSLYYSDNKYVQYKGNISTSANHAVKGNVVVPTTNTYFTFDGTDDYLFLGKNSDYVFGTSPFSTFAWLKSSYNGDYQAIFDTYSSNTGWQYLLKPSNGGMRVWLNTTYLDSSTDVKDGNWHHVGFTFDGSKVVKLYVDGVVDATGTNFTGINISSTTGSSASIGIQYSNFGYDFNGEISRVELYDRILTENEVLRNYNAQKSRFS